MSRILIDTEAGVFAMTSKAADAWRWATKLGIIDEEPSEIFHTLTEQEIVTYQNNHGLSVSFDCNDFVEA